MNKILIIGGAGYVGSSLSIELDKRGHDISIVDLLWFGNNLPNHLKNKVQKIDALELTHNDLSPFDTIIFIAGLSNDPMADYSPAKNFISNSATPAYIAYIAKTALTTSTIFVNDPSVWRPILALKDCISAYVCAVESDIKISGIFNIASDNYTVNQIANIVKNTIETEKNIKLNIIYNNIKDVRNYKVDCSKAKQILRFSPLNNVELIVKDLLSYNDFGDMENPLFYNIKTFSNL